MSLASWIDRERLVADAVAARVVLLSAPGGWGKTTLATQILQRAGAPIATTRVDDAADDHVLLAGLRRGLRRIGAGDLSALAISEAPGDALDALLGALALRAEAVALFVDEAHRLDEVAAMWLRSLADDLPAPHRLVIAGRSLDRALLRRPGAGWMRFDVSDLRFTTEEIGRVVGSTNVDECERVLAETDGWPAAVGLAVSDRPEPARPRVSASTEDRSLALGDDGGVLLERLVDDMLGPDRERLAVAGRLPVLDEVTLDLAAGVGAMRALIQSGIPMRRVGRWWSIADPIREVLASTVASAVPQALAIARCYDLPTGVTFLTTLGRPDDLEVLLAEAHWAELDQFAPRELAALIASLGEPQERSSHLLLNAARSAELRDPELRRRWLEVGLHHAKPGSDVWCELRAEAVRDQVRSADPDAERAVGQLLSELPVDAHRARARALLSLGIINAFYSSPERLAAAGRAFEEAAGLMGALGERRWHADVLNRLAVMVSYHGGSIAVAAEQQAASLALLTPGSRDWAIGMTYYSDILDTLGRSIEAESVAREAFDHGMRVGDAVTTAYGAWALAIVAAHRNDLDGTRRWLEVVERSPGNWSSQVAGQEFLAFGADLLGGLGDRDGAFAYRDRCAERVGHGGTQDLVDVVDGRLEAMYGDPERAIAILDRLDGEPYATIRSKWVRQLFRGLAALRLGERTATTRFIEQALELVDRMALPDLPHRFEPLLVSMLADVWPGGASSAETSAQITTLGRFLVVRGNDVVTPAPGNPATLVKMLALRGTLTIDQVVDALWPETDLTTGRSRLRNLLNRLRVQSGELVVRDGDALTLASNVATDVARFDQLVEVTLAAVPGERAGPARVAMAAYGGELLPADAYEDWAAGPRERLRRRYLSLIDIVSQDAIDRGDIDEACRLLDLGIEQEPLEEARYVRAAQALLDVGRVSTARDVVERAGAAFDELGVEVSASLAEIGRLLDVG
jgi:DNA-binding SARP family transcriptional activator